jgi:KaiC/GvpD/RAD55 family RecA-like ATPase
MAGALMRVSGSSSSSCRKACSIRNCSRALLYSSDLEPGETIKHILEAIERMKPKRIAIDSLSEIRLIAQSSLRYRRQILALKHHFARHNSTVIMLDDLTADATDRVVHSIATVLSIWTSLRQFTAASGDDCAS